MKRGLQSFHMQIRHSYVNKSLALKGLHLKNYGNMTTKTVYIIINLYLTRFKRSVKRTYVPVYVYIYWPGNS